MSLNEMNLEEVNARLEEISSEVETRSGEELEALEAETRDLMVRKAELEELEKRTADAQALTDGVVEPDAVIEKEEIRTMEQNKVITRDSVEYRDAFLAVCRGNATTEQRTIFADNTVAGDGASLPIGLDTQIWDQIYTNHPILADIDSQNFGIAIKVTQATPVGIAKKKDSDTITEMSVTFRDVTLAGNDYLAVVKLSYAEAKMSAGAMENYIAKAVVDQVGEAMAKDVFAQILTDAAANSTTKTGTYFEAIGAALGKAKTAAVPVIYANSADYYAILKEVDQNGQPIVREGVVLGAELKKDNAATKITILDPKDFILDKIAEVSLKVQDKVEEGCYVYGAYARAEGCMRKTSSAAFIA